MNNTTTTITTTLSSCIVLSWSGDVLVARGPTFALCLVALLVHAAFWIQLLFYPSVRQRGMLWFYLYLLTDLFLVLRFIVFYGQRMANTCVPISTRIYSCYFEAITKIYTNIIQSYILLGLNVCRYVQIVYNRNAYLKNIRSIILSNFAIFLLPLLNIAFQFLINWTQLLKKLGGLCDITYASVGVQVYNLIIVYAIPVSLNVLFLGLCIRFVKSTGTIQNQQIINNRRRFHRRILVQAIIFYTIWIVLWSPFVLSFQFVNVNSVTGIFTSMLNYVQIAIDPLIIAVIDRRLLKAWADTFKKILRKRPRIQPTLKTTTGKKY